MFLNQRSLGGFNNQVSRVAPFKDIISVTVSTCSKRVYDTVSRRAAKNTVPNARGTNKVKVQRSDCCLLAASEVYVFNMDIVALHSPQVVPKTLDSAIFNGYAATR